MSKKAAHIAYFTEFLPSVYGQSLVPELRGISACFEIDLKDTGEPPWRLVVENGQLVNVGHDGPEPVCTFHVDSGTFLGIVSGRESAQDAYFDMRIDVSGDADFGMMISTVLDAFFERYPYRPDEWS